MTDTRDRLMKANERTIADAMLLAELVAAEPAVDLPHMHKVAWRIISRHRRLRGVLKKSRHD